jgi:hypothetical protein
MGKRKTTKEFIIQARAKFGDRFDYSNTVYINQSTKVLISCKAHGEFELTPAQHIRSQQGCPYCPLQNLGVKPKTVEQFVSDAHTKHGDKFDYSRVVYKNNKEDVLIICKKHGLFFQSPCDHLKGVYGCRSCAPKGTKLTQDQFLARAKAVHGDRYDYSKTVYTLNKYPITIICREHGEFTLHSAGNHLSGHGCSDCPKVTDVSTQYWIKRVQKTHGNRYDYSKTEYLGAHKNLVITCNIHGLFSQRAGHHERGSNCPKCVNRHSYSNAEFISKCIAAHGDKYDYSTTTYNGAKSSMAYICPIHGKVTQQAYDHMSGHGCAYCAGRGKYTTEQWIELSREVHGNQYGYSKVNYQGKDKKVVIICPVHGDFQQHAGSHTRGSGCQNCANHGFNSNRAGYLYILHSYNSPLDMIKVGITNRLLPRFIRLQNVTPFDLICLKSVRFERGADALEIETQLKNFGKESHLSVNFNYKFEGHTECFRYSDDFINKMHSLVAKKIDATPAFNHIEYFIHCLIKSIQIQIPGINKHPLNNTTK